MLQSSGGISFLGENYGQELLGVGLAMRDGFSHAPSNPSHPHTGRGFGPSGLRLRHTAHRENGLQDCATALVAVPSGAKAVLPVASSAELSPRPQVVRLLAPWIVPASHRPQDLLRPPRKLSVPHFHGQPSG